MSMIVPPSVVEPFCAGGTVDVDYTVIPVPTQVAVSPELASYATGFPPATRLPKTSGGIPPRGKDMNGILRATTAHTAWVAAGGRYKFNSDVVTISGGYPLGAIIQSNADPTQFFQNLTANNTNDPNSVLTGWMSLTPQYSASAPTAGTHADNVLGGASDYFLDISTAAGAVTLNGFVSQRGGQKLVISNTGANPLTLGALAGTAGNQVRMSTAITLLQNDSISIQYVTAITAWVQV